MKPFLLFLTLFYSFQSLAQEDIASVQSCGRSKDIAGNQLISYYQYPSMNKYDIKYLKLDLVVETGSRVVSGSALTMAKATAPLDSFIIELKNNMIVDSLFINGTRQVFAHNSDHIYVPLVPAIPQGANVNALVYYRGTVANGIFAGTVPSNGLNYTATLSESFQAREWFPAKQFLKDKIDSADLWFTTSSINKVGSNGLLKSVVPVAGGKLQYRWKETYPMNYYMPSFSVGNYMEYLNYAKPAGMAPDSLLIQHYIVNNPTYFAGIKPNLDKTPVFIEKMSELFSMYPFKNEKYGHAHAAIGGGMEHQTMSTMAAFTSTLIAHELGHMWWGDNVTCATWNHIWLNEGFASYCEYLMIEKFPALIPSITASAFMQNYHNSVMSAAGGSLYVPDASVYDEGRIFSSRLSYAKGAAVIHNLRFEMQNEDLFFQVLKNYQLQFKDSVATTEDFKRVAETTSSKNLSDFFNQWVYGEGYPTFNINYFKEGNGILVLKINQTASMPSVTPFFKGLYEFKITSPAGDTTLLVNLSTNNQEFRFNYSKTPDGLIVDPNNWVLNAVGTITYGGVIIPLPPSQVSLSAIADASCTAQLNWITTIEHNISKYEVEYSTDNINFLKVGEVAGTNTNTDQQHNFSYRPAGQDSTHYFRLKIIDTLGNSRFSNKVTLVFNCNLIYNYSIKAGPNPTTGKVFIYVSSPKMEKIKIVLINILGEVLYSTEESIKIGNNTIQLDMMERVPAGTYILKIISNENKIIKKLIRN
ncbi:MAG: M1 family aminopeptidase [Ferruginibacter sp.]